MSVCLTLRATAVMTVHANARDICVVESRITPTCDGVAIIALVVALNMIGRFPIDFDVIVATITAVGRAGEHAFDMAFITLHIAVSAC